VARHGFWSHHLKRCKSNKAVPGNGAALFVPYIRQVRFITLNSLARAAFFPEQVIFVKKLFHRDDIPPAVRVARKPAINFVEIYWTQA